MNPGLAYVTFGIDSERQDGCHQKAHTTDLIQNGATVDSRATTFVMESDEPMALLGTDKAASPAQYVLQALAACYAVTTAANAAVRGIDLNSLKFEMQTDFDLHGFLGLNDSVRPGAQEIRVTVHAEARNASREQLEDLIAAVQQRSPIRDTLVNAVTIHTVLAPQA